MAALREAAKEARSRKQGGSWERVVCTADQLQTCLKCAVYEEEIAAMTSAARKLVGQFRHSMKATHCSLSRSRSKSSATGHKVHTRRKWNSPREEISSRRVHQVEFNFLHVQTPGRATFAYHQSVVRSNSEWKRRHHAWSNCLPLGSEWGVCHWSNRLS